MKIIEEQKAINNSQWNHGVGKAEDNILDRFVVTRVVNHPELVFNQSTLNDASTDKRYFDRNHALKWRLSRGNECFMCTRHGYTIVFYVQSEDRAQN